MRHLSVCIYAYVAGSFIMSDAALAQHFVDRPFKDEQTVGPQYLQGKWKTHFGGRALELEVHFKDEETIASEEQVDWLHFRIKEIADGDALERRDGADNARAMSGIALVYVLRDETYVVFGDFLRPFPDSLNSISSLSLYSVLKLKETVDDIEVLALEKERVIQICKHHEIEFMVTSGILLISCSEKQLIEIIKDKTAFSKVAELRRHREPQPK